MPALAALAFMLAPAEVWSNPAVDFTQRGFDPETVYVDDQGARYAFAPFLFLTNGDWQSCPCAPGSQLVLVGSNLSEESAFDPEGRPELGRVAVTVDGEPTRVYAVTPTQINFFLRSDVQPPLATIRLLRNGVEVASQVLPVSGPGPSASGAATVSVQQDSMHLRAAAGHQPAVHVLTTPLSFQAAFDVAVDGIGSGQPFEVMVWNPRNYAGVHVAFGPPPAREIEAFTTEAGGIITQRKTLGRYSGDTVYRLQVGVERQKRVSIAVSRAGRPLSAATISSDQAADLFKAYRPTLTMFSTASEVPNTVSVTNYRLDLPHQRTFAVRADDGRIQLIAAALLALAALLHLPVAAGALGTGYPSASSVMRCVRGWWWVVPVIALYSGVLIVLMPLGSHPFDMASQRIWTYLLTTNGVDDLYYQAQTVPVANVWNGMPFHEGVYPYGVVMSYFFMAVGWVHALLGGDVSPGSSSLAMSIKVANLALALVDGALIWAIVRRIASAKLATAAAALFLLNPAMMFDLAIWGETESVALFFVLASLNAAQRGSPRMAWAMLAFAFMSKQTVVLPAALLGIYYLRLFPLAQTMDGLAVAAPLALAATMPFVLAGYAPSIAVDPILSSFMVFGGTDMDGVFKVVSFDAYSVWPLVTLLRNGVHGTARLQFPDSFEQVGPLSYHQVGVLGVLGVAAALALWLFLSRRVKKEPCLIVAVLAFALLAELVLPTRSIARYFIFPLVFAVLALPQSPKLALFVVAALSVTSLVGMAGSVASGLDGTPSLAPALAPDNSAISRLALDLSRSDLMITAGSVLNLAALIALGVMVWFPARQPAAAGWQPRFKGLVGKEHEAAYLGGFR